jgi:hypothetical protein
VNSTDKQKNEELISSIPCGKVLIFSHKSFKTDKPKFTVLVYKEINVKGGINQIYCMTINSDIARRHKEHRCNDYACITAKDYKFLSHAQSYINCINILPIPIKDIVSQYDTLFPRKDKDAKISKQTRDDILRIVERLKDIDTATKSKVTSGLKSI